MGNQVFAQTPVCGNPRDIQMTKYRDTIIEVYSDFI
jgi:hypothetical protein